MDTIRLFFKFKFTSHSPDAQPISLGIVSDTKQSPSFYAEFTDFDMDRCTEQVLNSVVADLGYEGKEYDGASEHSVDWEVSSTTSFIGSRLGGWLTQFKDSQIQFVTDCGVFDWPMLLRILDEREQGKGFWLVPEEIIPREMTAVEFLEELHNKSGILLKDTSIKKMEPTFIQTRDLFLPEYISPVVEDLNGFLAAYRGITHIEAFKLDRLKFFMSFKDAVAIHELFQHDSPSGDPRDDVRLIKAIYNKIME